MDDRQPSRLIEFHMSDIAYMETGFDNDSYSTEHIFLDAIHKHIVSRICPCGPILEYEDPKDGSELWVHHVFH